MNSRKKRIAKKLIEIGNSPERKELAFTGHKEANQLVLSNPFAFLLAVIFDQGILAEKAWKAPFDLRERLGHLNVREIARANPVALEKIIRTKPALHRFPAKLAKWIIAAAQQVERLYGGNTSAIWSGNLRANDLQNRFNEFDGISQKKASMATNILVRDFGVRVKDKQGLDVSYDVQVRRVFLRTGLVIDDAEGAIVGAARELNPDYPGALDLAAWEIGRAYCRPKAPRCSDCPLDLLCPKTLRGGALLPEPDEVRA